MHGSLIGNGSNCLSLHSHRQLFVNACVHDVLMLLSTLVVLGYLLKVCGLHEELEGAKNVREGGREEA